jgi:predicted RNA-binding Zn-ribbon protein involved in translation (DUF1610 family)
VARYAYIPMHCASDGAVMMGRFEQSDGQWALLKVDILRGRTTGSPTADQQLSGAFAIGADYSGCPECGNDSFMRCGQCEKLTCWSSETSEAKCGACGHTGPMGGEISDVNASDLG